jgi:S1-C subfamily serine protease
MNSWRRAFHAAAVGILGIGLGACTYHGALRPDIYLSTGNTAPNAEKKVPMKVAVLKNKMLENRALRIVADISAAIRYDDALTNAVETSLSKVFTGARLIDDPTKADSGELLAEYDMQFREEWRQSNNWRFGTLCTIQLKDPSSGLVVTKVRHGDELHYSPPAGAWAAAFATGFSLFLLSPITIPLTTMAVGREAERLVEDAIRTSVSATSAQLVTDPRLIAFVRARDSSDPVVIAPTRPDLGRIERMPPSKYDDYLSAVVIVRSSGGLGSGFFVSKTGLIITNHHVVGRDATVSLKLRSGSVIMGTVIASDVNSDLALISVPHESPVWLQLAGPEEGGIGADVIAIGTPKGFEWSVSRGIVSALREDGATRLVQTDAAINKGNSGGPLILLDSGRVIGVNALSFRKDGAVGLNFAVSAQTVIATFGPYLKR